MNNKGQMTIGALALTASISIAVLGSISAWILRVDTKAQNANDGVAGIRTEINGINTKLDFILGKYGFNYNYQTQQVEPLKQIMIKE